MQINLLANPLLIWYDKEKRDLPFRENKDPYQIWISEVMLQQTKVSTVIPYFKKWINYYPDIKTVAKANLTDLLKIWEGLGYYGRCRNFYKAAIIVCNRYNGKIPNNWELFFALPGVGEYTAAAVLSIAYNMDYPVLDGNVKRVMFRILGLKKISPTNINKIKKNLQNIIPEKNPGDFNQGMMELGALICIPMTPKCLECPVSSFCKAFKNGNPSLYPNKIKRKKTPHYDYTSGIIWKEKYFLIQKRKENVMLGGLWELPNFKNPNINRIKDFFKNSIKESLEFEIKILNTVCSVKHKYSHFSITMSCFNCELKKEKINSKKEYKWILPRDIELYPFSKVNHKVFKHLNKDIINV